MLRYLLTALRILSLCVIAIGIAGLLGHFWLDTSDLTRRRDVEWPVGRTSVAVALPDGRYAVPLDYVDRIQVYSNNLKFQYGWQLPGVSSGMTLVCRHDGRLEAFYTGRHLTNVYDFIFEPDGTLNSRKVYDRRSGVYPSLASLPQKFVTLTIPQRWWAPFAKSPLYFWLMLLAGLLLGVASTPQNWPGARRTDMALAPEATPRDLIR